MHDYSLSVDCHPLCKNAMVPYLDKTVGSRDFHMHACPSSFPSFLIVRMLHY